jgi:hypothetical protein
MLKIDLKEKIETQEDGSETKHQYIVANGIVDEESYYYMHENYHHANFYKKEVIDLVESQSFDDWGKHFTYISYNSKVDWWDNEITIGIYCKNKTKIKAPSFHIDLHIDEWWHWSKPWSISNFAKEFESNIEIFGNAKINYFQEEPDSLIAGFGILYDSKKGELIIGSELTYLMKVLKDAVIAANKNLMISLDNEAVLTYFQFPEEIKTACKQYLIYFTQFITDMGILVDTELKEELNNTLFKIIPKNKNESLERIKEVLNIYLHAPNENNFQVEISNQTDIAIKQWEANFYHLKSQLSLAKSIIQTKDATIETLQISNYQYKQLLENHMIKKEGEKEDIIKGIISVKKFEGKGFTIDLAEIFRRLKRVIK